MKSARRPAPPPVVKKPPTPVERRLDDLGEGHGPDPVTRSAIAANAGPPSRSPDRHRSRHAARRASALREQAEDGEVPEAGGDVADAEQDGEGGGDGERRAEAGGMRIGRRSPSTTGRIHISLATDA
jgi:hypothetical protein